MKLRDVYLTFKTDETTAYLLKTIAKAMNKTQPELINEICKEFITELNNDCEEKLIKEGYTKEKIYKL